MKGTRTPAEPGGLLCRASRSAPLTVLRPALPRRIGPLLVGIEQMTKMLPQKTTT
jgi:hypothetical protein